MGAQDVSQLGDLLRARRLESALTQEDLAERAGISARAIADLERGVIRAPRRDTLELLANALDLTSDERRKWEDLRRTLSVRQPRPGQAEPALSSLPHPPNPLVGREREINALVNLMAQPDSRLVTITGPGGVGKTRIALAVGRELTGTFADGIQFVELAAVRNPDLLIPTVAQQFGIREGDPAAIRERLLKYLSDRNLLLILDNAEHLRTAARSISEMLSASTSLNLLVTSRSGLRLAAEHEFPVSPLGLPSWDTSRGVDRPQNYPAIQLFVQRGQQVRPDFGLTPDNGAAIASICAYLDGIPLAIELAAARVRVLSPQQMLPKLVDRLSFLTDGMADAPDRHRTMRTAIGWSYELLDEEDQAFFRQLSAFVGGWTLEAAEAVAPDGIDAVEGLSRLGNDNLIHRSASHPDGNRFGMLETVREFGLEQLELTSELEPALRRHAEYFLQLAEAAEPELKGRNQVGWLARLEDEVANFRSALEWSQHPDGDPEIGIRLVAALSWFWEGRGYVSEGREWLRRALQRDTSDLTARMKALSGAGWLAHIQHDSENAYRHLNESLTLARENGDGWYEAWILHLLGRVAYFDGDSEEAHRYGGESLSVARQLGDQWIIAWDYHLFGLASFIAGDLDAARKNYAASLEIREEIEYPEGICLINGLTGVLMLREGDQENALQYFRRALKIGKELGARWLIINWIANIVLIAADHESAVRAARLAGFVEAMSTLTGAIPIPINDATFQRGVETARNQLPVDEFERLYAEGQTLSLDEAIDEALLVEWNGNRD